MRREEMARLIRERLEGARDDLRAAWQASRPVRHFACDDLLPPALVGEIHAVFPGPADMRFSDDLRERKYAGRDTSRFHPLVNAILHAFQDPGVLAAVSAITGIQAIESDPSLYASGVSMMAEGHFLNPHIDNSHDGEVKRYRVLNALFYVTPGWTSADGGSLELWDARGVERTEVPALCNRLVVMETDRRSWHSVNPVLKAGQRCCVSNYYFSKLSPAGRDYRHVTTFKGRPGQGARSFVLRLDATARNVFGRFLSNRTLEAFRKAAYRRRDQAA